MTQKVLTKKTFIGHGSMGHMGYPGDVVDVDAKGIPQPADSTPVGSLTVEQLQARLERLQKADKPEKAEPDFGKNVADPVDTNTGAQPLAMAAVAPHAPSATQPQTLPPGTEQVGDRFVRRAPEEAPAALEEVVANTPEQIDGVDGGIEPRKPGRPAKAKD